MDIDESDVAAARRRTDPKRRKLTACRFCIYVVGILLLLLGGLVAWSIFSALRGLYRENATPMRSLTHPHAPKKVNVKSQSNGKSPAYNESEVVRSFFGKQEHGGIVEQMDLHASVWYRPSWSAESSAESFDSTSAAWQLMYHDKVFQSLSPGLRKASTTRVNVSLPRAVVDDVRDSVNETVAASLIATFELMPASGSSSHMEAVEYHHFFEPAMEKFPDWPVLAPPYPPLPSKTSIGTLLENIAGLTTASGTSFGLPRNPATVPDADLGDRTALANMLHKASVQASLLVRRVNHTEGEIAPRRLQPQLRTVSWVTMVREKPVYALDKFRKKMETIKYEQIECWGASLKSGIPPSRSACLPSPNTIGHAAGLLEVKDNASSSASTTHWRYPPFLSSHAGIVTPRDIVDLPSRATEGSNPDTFDFEWSIGFSTSSTLKLDMTLPILSGMLYPDHSNMSDYELASHLDFAEWFRAMLNFQHDTQGRPILRSLLYFAGGLSHMVAGLAFLHYLMTRSLTTGISLQPLIVGPLAEWLHQLNAINPDGDDSFWFGYVVAACGGVMQLLLCLNVACRLDWRWGSARWTGWIPCGVSRRRATHSERASSRLDWEFGWWQRLALLSAMAAFLHQAAALHIISANPPRSPDEHQQSLLVIGERLESLLDAILQALHYGYMVQLILNARSKTFAGHHRLGAYCAFAGALCSMIPVILHRHLGRDELMKPLMMGHALELALKAWQAWQATAYPVVKQEEPESE